jgi:periplasmic protein TonB
MAAAVVVGAVHAAGAALALMQWQAEKTSQDAAGSMMVELAPLVAVTPVDSPDVAHGPLLEEALLTPQASKQAIEETPKDIPLIEPSPAPEPEVALPTPRPEEKEEPKKEEATEAVPGKQDAEQASAAPLTTAPPRVEAEPARSSAPARGRTASAAQVQASWQKALIDQLNRHKRYPNAARSSRAQGVVVVAFRLDRSGQLIASRVTKTSGSPALDEEALAVLKRASPLPAPPAQIPGPMLDLVLPIQFRIK